MSRETHVKTVSLMLGILATTGGVVVGADRYFVDSDEFALRVRECVRISLIPLDRSMDAMSDAIDILTREQLGADDRDKVRSALNDIKAHRDKILLVGGCT